MENRGGMKLGRRSGTWGAILTKLYGVVRLWRLGGTWPERTGHPSFKLALYGSHRTWAAGHLPTAPSATANRSSKKVRRAGPALASVRQWPSRRGLAGRRDDRSPGASTASRL